VIPMRLVSSLLLVLALLFPGVAGAQWFHSDVSNNSLSFFSSRPSGPSLDLVLTNGAMPAGITFARASSGTYYAATGTMQTAATNAPRFDYGPTPGGVTNYIRNSTLQGATVGTPGVLPTFMSIGSVSGVAFNVVNITTVNGLPCFDIQVVGTPATSATVDLTFDSVAMGAYLNFTESVSTALVGGSMNNIAVAALTAGTGGINVAANTTATLTRVSVSSTGLSFNPGAVTPGIRFSFTASQAVNAIIRIGGPQFEYAPTVGTYVPTTGAINTVGAIPLGLLIEEQRTNVLLQSTLATSWFTSYVTEVANAAIAPDGTLSAASITQDTLNAEHYTQQTPAIAANVVYALSIFVKPFGAQRYVNLSLYDNTTIPNSASAVFDLQNGTVTATANNGTATGSAGTVTAGLNGWYRIILTATPSAAANTGVLARICLFNGPTTSSNSFTGDGVSGVFAWGADLQAGAFATSYIPTTSAAATRAADTATMPVGPWFNPNAGTWAAQFITEGAFVNGAIIGQSNNRVRPLYVGSGNTVAQYDTTNNVATANTFALRSVVKAASSWASNVGMTVLNGGTVASGTMTAGYPSLAAGVKFFSDGNAVDNTSGWLGRVRYWPRALSSAELQGDTQ
jgi:hypothetical protein